ncbi:KxYKxGKxW signal peptide domain-containing protein, partial [Liquorilactobacillus nagelii]
MWETKLHYKMYKKGKQWVCASIAVIAFSWGIALNNVKISADSTPQNVVEQSSSSNDSSSNSSSSSKTSSSSKVNTDQVNEDTSSSITKENNISAMPKKQTQLTTATTAADKVT